MDAVRRNDLLPGVDGRACRRGLAQTGMQGRAIIEAYNVEPSDPKILAWGETVRGRYWGSVGDTVTALGGLSKYGETVADVGAFHLRVPSPVSLHRREITRTEGGQSAAADG